MEVIPEPIQCVSASCGLYDERNGWYLKCEVCHEMDKVLWKQLRAENEQLLKLLKSDACLCKSCRKQALKGGG